MAQGQTIYDPANITFLHHTLMALRALYLIEKDTHYVMRGSQIVIVDELSGRAMAGRRFGGLHQALEAKEGLPIRAKPLPLPLSHTKIISLYDKLAGMTGTAATEAEEFGEIYGLEIAEIPTNQDVIRIDHDDEVYLTSPEKLKAIIAQIETCHERGQPVLVGTVSVEKSEIISDLLKKKKLSTKSSMPAITIRRR